MADLALYYPEGHESHYEAGHPERPERIAAIWSAFEAGGWIESQSQVESLQLPDEVLLAVHSQAHLSRLEEASERGSRLDADTYTTEASAGLAHRVAGGAAAVAGCVWRREAQRGFALTRPPGHHATTGRAMGFCLLNNIALAAEYLLQDLQAARLAIVDVDLHHGNGTQEIFYRREEVLYLSTHQYPFYPGTGALDEVGSGAGQGATANFPLPAFTGDRGFLEVFEGGILPLLDRFRPEMILVSAGFDPHWRDPLGQLLLTVDGYARLIQHLANWADVNCQGRIALFLEGGYDLQAGAACAQASVAALLDERWDDPIGPPPWPERDGWLSTLAAARALWGLD